MSNRASIDGRHTVVQHSGYGYARKPGFEKGLETRCCTQKDEQRVEKVGGLLFQNYDEAQDFVTREMFPDGYQGLYPKAPGTFSFVQVDGLKVYCPATP